MRHRDRNRRTRTVEELRQEVDRRAIAQLEALLEPDAIEGTIKEIFQNRVEAIVCSALGFERDSWHDGWKLREHSSEKKHAVHRLIADTAEGLAKQMLPTLLETITEEMNLKPLLVREARSTAKALFKECCYHELSCRLKDSIDAKADSAVAEVLREKFEVRLAADLRSDQEKRGG